MCAINRHLRFPQDVDETQDLANAPLRGLAKEKLRIKRASLSSLQKAVALTTFLGVPRNVVSATILSAFGPESR